MQVAGKRNSHRAALVGSLLTSEVRLMEFESSPVTNKTSGLGAQDHIAFRDLITELSVA
jgi:hypothetical protein